MGSAGQKIRKIIRAVLPLSALLAGFTTALNAATYTVNTAADGSAPPPPTGSYNLRTALQAAGAGDTVNFSTTPPGSSTDMNGQTTTLGSSIQLNSTGAGAPIILDITGLTSGSPTGFTVVAGSGAFPGIGIAYNGSTSTSLSIIGNGVLNFNYITGGCPFQNTGAGTFNINISNGTFYFSNGSGSIGNASHFEEWMGGGGTNVTISGGTFVISNAAGFSSSGSSPMTNTVSGGNFSFSNASVGFQNNGTAPMINIFQGGTFSFTGTNTGGFFSLLGSITNTFQGGTFSFIGAGTLGFWVTNTQPITNTISGGTFLFDGAPAAFGATLDFSTGNGTFISGVNGTTFGGTDPVGTPKTGSLILGAGTTHQVWIASSGGTPTSLPVSMQNTTGGGSSTASLGGALDVVSSYIPNVQNQTFTIVTADAGSTIIGNYATASSSQGIPILSVNYIPQGSGPYTSVSVTIGSIPSLGSNTTLTHNEQAVGNYLTSISGTASGALAQAIQAAYVANLAGNTTALKTILDQLCPSVYGVLGQVGLNSMLPVTESGHAQMQSGRTEKSVREEMKTTPTAFDAKRLASFSQLITNHTMNAMNATNTLSSSGLTRGPGAPQRKGVLSQVKPTGFTNSPEAINRHQPQAGRIQVGKANVWVQPYGQLVSQRGNVNAPGLNSQLGGIALGADYEVTPDTILGVLGGTSTSPFQWYQNRGNGKMSSGYGGLYAGWKDESGFYLEGQTIFGGNKFSTTRNIIFPGSNQAASASHNAFQFTGNFELGVATPIYDWFTAQPFIMADYFMMRERGYTESGAGTLNMTINPATSQFIQAEIGCAFYKTFALGETLLRPTAELGWVQRQPITNGRVKGGFVGQQSSLVVTGLNKVYNQFAPGLGLIAQFKNGLSVSANTYAQVGDGLNIGEALVRIGYEF